MDEPTTVRRDLTIGLPGGLHLAPCSMIAKLAAQFDGSVRLTKGEVEADARMVTDLLLLNAPQGTPLVLEVQGEEASIVADQIERLFRSDFDGLAEARRK